MPDPAEVDSLVLQLGDVDDLWKTLDALDERIFDRRAETARQRQEAFRRRSWSRKKITRGWSRAWRIAPIGAFGSSAARSTPRSSAPTAPAIGLTSKGTLRTHCL